MPRSRSSSHQLTALVNGDIFVSDDAVQHGVLLDHRVLKEDAALHHGALLHLDAAEQDAVLHAALDIAAVGNEGVDTLAAGCNRFLWLIEPGGESGVSSSLILQPQACSAALVVRVAGTIVATANADFKN